MYVAARAGFEPMTLQSKGFGSTKAPPRSTYSNTFTLIRNKRRSNFTGETGNVSKESHLFIATNCKVLTVGLSLYMSQQESN